MSVIDETKYEFCLAESQEQLRQVYSVSKLEWGRAYTPEGYVDHFCDEFERQTKLGKELKAFYLKSRSSGTAVASCVVNEYQGFYRQADRSQPIASAPDPAAFGVKNIVVLHLEMVFVDSNYRGKKLGEGVVAKSIEYMEKYIIDKEIEKSDPNSNESFANMVKDSQGRIDYILANYYLSKKYIWHLYSSADTFYSRFGFKPYPMPMYTLPPSTFLFMNETLDFLLKDPGEKLASFVVPGKLLQWLQAENPQHQQIIQSIYQAKELEIMMDLSKTTFHLQLAGLHNSSSSLTNMSNILSYSKAYGGSGSSAGLAQMAFPELVSELSASPAADVEGTRQRRQSSIVQTAVSKFAMKPDYQLFSGYSRADSFAGKLRAESGDLSEDEDPKSWTIQGAILTNELQRKSYYILWQCLLGGSSFFIISMGEISSDLAGNGAFSVQPFPNRRRGSSFTGLNDLGGINFQDLDILLSAAARVASQRKPIYSKHFFVSPNDLPPDLPVAMAHDYFMNYLPSKKAEGDENLISFLENAGPVAGVLPMLKMFGDKSTNFELDWVSNGMWSWS